MGYRRTGLRHSEETAGECCTPSGTASLPRGVGEGRACTSAPAARTHGHACRCLVPRTPPCISHQGPGPGPASMTDG